MGLMYGKIRGDTMYVMDSFELPVEGTETRVNAQAEGYEYMVAHTTKSKQASVLNAHSSVNICTGWKEGECNRLVSFSSRLWMLAEWNRRADSGDEPTVP